MKKILSTIVLISLLLTSCGKTETPVVSESKNLKSVKTMVLENKPITEQVKLVWKVYPDKEVTVSSQISGIINAVIHNVWDTVSKDSILATIDTNSQIWVTYQNSLIALSNNSNIYSYSKESINKDMEAAKLTLENAKTNKINMYAMTEKQLSISQKQLDNVVSNRVNTVISNDENVKWATLWVDISEKSYQVAQSNIDNYNKNSVENTKSLLDKKISLLRNSISSIQNAYVNIEQWLTFADNILWVTDKNKDLNNSFETYLWARDASKKIQAEDSLKKLIGNYDKNISYVNNLDEKLSNDIKNLDFNKTDWSYQDNLDAAQKFLNDTKKMLSDLNDTLSNTIATTTLSQTTIDGYKTTIWLKQSAIIWSETWIIWLKNSLFDINNNISSTVTSIDTNMVSLENALSIAKVQLDNAKQNLSTLKSNIKLQADSVSWNVDLTREQLNNTIATIKNSRDQADNWVKIAEAQLNSSLAKLNSQLAQSKSQLDSSKWQTDLASIALKNSVIKSPFDAVVVSKLVEVWTLVNPGTPIFTLSSNDKMKIKVDMTIDNVSNLTVWNEVKLELINWNTASWSVSLVPKSADPKTNLFQVEISFDNGKLKSKIGEFVNVYLDKKYWDKNLIMVPFEAVLNISDWVYNVFVISSSWSVSSREVTLWIKNSLNTEILTWLKEKEIIAISKVWDLEDGDLVDMK